MDKYGFSEFDFIYFYDEENKSYVVGQIINICYENEYTDIHTRTESFRFNVSKHKPLQILAIEYYMIGGFESIETAKQHIEDGKFNINSNRVFEIHPSRVLKLPIETKFNFVFHGIEETLEFTVFVPEIKVQQKSYGIEDNKTPYITTKVLFRNDIILFEDSRHGVSKGDNISYSGDSIVVTEIYREGTTIHCKTNYVRQKYVNAREDLLDELKSYKEKCLKKFDEVRLVFEKYEEFDKNVQVIKDLTEKIEEISIIEHKYDELIDHTKNILIPECKKAQDELKAIKDHWVYKLLGWLVKVE